MSLTLPKSIPAKYAARIEAYEVAKNISGLPHMVILTAEWHFVGTDDAPRVEYFATVKDMLAALRATVAAPAPRVSLDKPAAPEAVAVLHDVPQESNAVVMARAVEVVRDRRLAAEHVAGKEEYQGDPDAGDDDFLLPDEHCPTCGTENEPGISGQCEACSEGDRRANAEQARALAEEQARADAARDRAAQKTPALPLPTVIEVPAISIMHLKQTTRDWLTNLNRYATSGPWGEFLNASHDNGFFLTVPACQACADEEQHKQWAALPGDLRTVFDVVAPHARYAWFLLDVDGDPLPGLPLYTEEEHTETPPGMVYLTTDAHALDDEIEADMLRIYGVTIVKRKNEPWEVVFMGEPEKLRAMYAAYWCDGEEDESNMPPLHDINGKEV